MSDGNLNHSPANPRATGRPLGLSSGGLAGGSFTG